ncbi:MAG: hypothetical protein JRJ12_07490 [Deltaproteobacteria bacterium]|nr:hypothetical protein [Deltaproteobacteria bacterium]MBW2071299.1 hypothetical protein [Deltaproteobacteria bacterium]
MAQEGDVVLVHVEDKPTFFARIESIEPDVKPQWFQVGLLVLQVPLIQITWILRQEYIDGTAFTMGGKKVVLEKVVSPNQQVMVPEEGEKGTAERKGQPEAPKEKGKVISLFPRE